MKVLSLFISVVLILPTSFSQSTITGTIKDETTQLPIPYTSVGVTGTFYGTLSDQNGNFTLTIPAFTNADSIRISSIGYKTLAISKTEMDKNSAHIFFLAPVVYDLTEVKVKPKNLGYKFLGTSEYSKNICTAFMGKEGHWIGEQAAIQANNKEGVTVFIESFGFYIIKNEYVDSLKFRIMLYEMNKKGYPGKTFLKNPIIFKTNIKQGEVRVNLKDHQISTTGDFFISLECLEEKVESSKFCFAGSIKVPSFFTTSAFSRWGKVKGGGGDFNVKVSYVK